MIVLMWTILITITFLIGWMAVWSIVTDEYKALQASLVFLLLVGVVGWLLWGGCTTVDSTEEPIQPLIIKTPTAVIVEYEGMRRTFTDIETYNLADSTCFAIRTNTNMYGKECGKLIVKCSEGKEE